MSDFQRRSTCLSLLVAASVGLAACGSLNSASSSLASVVTPYKMDIVQGNFVSKEQATAVKPGMTRLQVRDLMGTPLLTSIFHADRWDYVFTFKRQGLEPQARRVTVFFKGDLMERLEGDELPTEAEFVASLDSGRQSGKVPVLEMAEPASLSQSAPVPEATPLPPVPATYPPLEPAGR
jgi:outer membrane protein assembly factor BamE